MKFLEIVSVLSLAFCTATALAGTAETTNAWTVYSGVRISHNRTATLIQSKSQERYANASDQQVQAEIDVLCSNGKIVALAVDTHSQVAQQSVNPNGGVDTTLVSFSLGGQPMQSEPWAVLDRRQTLTPYAEILQGRRTRKWIERLASGDQLMLEFHSAAGPQPLTFRTGGFMDALASAGCSY